MLAEFKEKTYEKYFGYELARVTNVTYSPDQCDENVLGFDDAYFLPWELLRHRLPYMRRRRWSKLHGLTISQLDEIGDEISRRLPPFRFNLFVQYKRPEYITRSNAAEWSCWFNPYFRYETTPHQQDMLAEIEHGSHGRAATVYAAPAFWRCSDLWSHVSAGRIVAESNIVSVGRLKGHGRFSYQAAGSCGLGHSDPIRIEGLSLQQLIADGLNQEGAPFNRHIKRAARLVEEVLTRDDAATSLMDQARVAALGEGAAETPRESLLFALATLEAFSEAFDVSFYAIG
jgi:hypothetical protein